MYQRIALTAPLLIACACGAAPIDSFTIEDGNFRYAERNLQGPAHRTGTSGGLADYGEIVGGNMPTDHMFQNWWWYRIADPFRPMDSDPREYALSRQTEGTSSGNQASLTYTEPGQVAPTMQAAFMLNYSLTRINAKHALLSINWSILNVGDRSIDVDFFAYADADVGGTVLGDTSVFSTPLGAKRLTVTDNPAEFALSVPLAANIASAAIRYENGGFAGIRNKLTNAGIDNLTNAAAVFGPGDATGAFQFKYEHIGIGQSVGGMITKTLILPSPAGGLALAAGLGIVVRRRR